MGEIRPELKSEPESRPQPPQTQDAEVSDEGYKPALSNRQVQMIAMGGAIGVGLFYGTGEKIAAAGPGLVLSFAVAKLSHHADFSEPAITGSNILPVASPRL